MTMWVIFAHPTDYEEGYVLRPQYVVAGHREPVIGTVAWKVPSLEAAQALLPVGLSLCPISEPNPFIAEVWW